MGCDIHAAIEYFVTPTDRNGLGWHALMVPNKYFGKWDDEPKETARIHLDRNYNLFAILANVRNGFGFAGCKTGEGFTFISDNRGLPINISQEARELGCTGDHSDTWVSLLELLRFDWEQVATLSGVVTAIEFEQWDRMKEWHPAPASYCGDRSGPGVRNVSEKEMRTYIRETIGDKRGADFTAAQSRLGDRLQTRISWRLSYTECASQIWSKILPKMLKLGTRYGYENVRLVMNFDS